MPLIKRLVKGTPLTFAEGDANLDYLENLALNPFPYSGSAEITGSLTVTNGITGSLLGTAQTASYALNAVAADISSKLFNYYNLY